MDFIAFPVRIGPKGGLDRSADRGASVIQLIKIMITTPQRGWRGSPEFGLRETFMELAFKHGLKQIAVIKQMNQSLTDLGIGWVRVKEVELIATEERGCYSYSVTLIYPGTGIERHQIDI